MGQSSSVHLNLAIGCMSAWLVPHVGIEIVDYRMGLRESVYWTQSDELMRSGNRAITIHGIIAVEVAVVLNLATAMGISLTSQTLDPKAISIITGLSRLLSAFVIFAVSYKTPKWLGVYYSSKEQFGEPVGRSLKHLRFNVRWSIWRHFLQVYFLMMPFYCGAAPETIPVSSILGIIAGCLIYFGIYVGRTKLKQQKTALAIIMATIISICSAAAFASGCYYIQQVWGRGDLDGDELRMRRELRTAFIAFFSWLIAIGLFHLVLVYNTRQKLREGDRMASEGMVRPSMTRYKTEMFKPSMTTGRSKSNLSASQKESISASQRETPAIREEEEEEYYDDFQRTTRDHEQPGTPETAPVALGDEEELLQEEHVTTCGLLKMHCCGKAEQEGEREPKTCVEKVVTAIKWIMSIVVNGLFIYFTIMNIGASMQTAAVQAQLPHSFRILYPPDYNIGPMCGWDDKGPNSTIKTFATVNDTLAAGFKVVHCGECAACSTWNDLRLQWTTRTYLAAIAQNCAKKSLMGTFDDVHACNRDEIGFSEDCAMCWTVDELCAKKNCVFIFLQGVLINKLTNFKVGPGEITSATCDEAMCGPEFVPCSGATRRRMDIRSSIPRPADQQCRPVKEDWATVFDHP